VVTSRKRFAENLKMTTTKILSSLLMTALLGWASAHAADDSIQVAMQDGKTIAQFKIGDTDCRLVDGQIRCTYK
jgi:hypothetical protein